MNKEKNKTIDEIKDEIIKMMQNKQTRMKLIKFLQLAIQHIYQSWDKIKTRLKVAFDKVVPDIETIVKELEENLKLASTDVEAELNDILEAIFSLIEKYFEDLKNTFLKHLKTHPEPIIFLDILKESAPQIEQSISQQWNINDFQSELIIKEIKNTENKIRLLHSDNSQFLMDKLIKFSKSEQIKKDVTDNYLITGLNVDRIPLIHEAIDLHLLESFGGSVTLLYSQIEGIITDALIIKSYAEYKNNRVVFNNKALPGLSTKIKHAGQQFHELEEFFNELFQGKIVVEQTISQSRNAALHGKDVQFANQTQSLSLILCLYSLIMKVRLLFEK